MISSNKFKGAPTDRVGGLADLDRPDLGRETVASIAIVGVFLFGLIGWAAVAPLESAAIAQGVVSVDGYRKTVQHLEGGIVGEILVREGERVAAGQVLIRLDDTTPRASQELLHTGAGWWPVRSRRACWPNATASTRSATRKP